MCDDNGSGGGLEPVVESVYGFGRECHHFSVSEIINLSAANLQIILHLINQIHNFVGIFGNIKNTK
jgi:hypothetical protein